MYLPITLLSQYIREIKEHARVYTLVVQCLRIRLELSVFDLNRGNDQILVLIGYLTAFVAFIPVVAPMRKFKAFGGIGAETMNVNRLKSTL
jgi:hypothetical protein